MQKSYLNKSYIGWRSEARWKIKCQNDNTWSHSKFSQCVTCDSIDSGDLGDGVQMKRVYNKNLPVVKFFCGDATSSMDFMGTTYKTGSAYRNAKCLCKNGQNGDPS